MIVHNCILSIDGMRCQRNCATKIFDAIGRIDTVSGVSVRKDVKAALIEGTTPVSKLTETVEAMGFGVAEVVDVTEKQRLQDLLLPHISRTIYLKIRGMIQDCVESIENCLKSVSGTTEVTVSFYPGSALVKGNCRPCDLIKSVKRIGFDATLPVDSNEIISLKTEINKLLIPQGEENEKFTTVVLDVQGMTCQKNCCTTVERCLAAVPGVELVLVSFFYHAALIEGAVCAKSLIDAIEAINFGASEIRDEMNRTYLIDRLRLSVQFEVFDTRGAHVELIPENRSSDEIIPNDFQRAEISISGMTCSSCVGHIERSILKLSGVHSISVALIAEKALIEYDSDIIAALDIANKIENLGYKSIVLSENVPMNSECMKGVNKFSVSVLGESSPTVMAKLVSSVDGVRDVSINGNVVAITHETEIIGVRELFSHIKECGVECTIFSGEMKSSENGNVIRRSYWRIFYTSLLFTIPILLLSQLSPHIPTLNDALGKPTSLGIDWYSFLLWILCTPVQFFCASTFYRSAWMAITSGSANMDVLVVLGTSSAYFYSVVSIIVTIASNSSNQGVHRDAIFFETSAMLLSFVLLGRSLESSARKRTLEAITELMNLQPDSAILVLSNSNDTNASSMFGRKPEFHDNAERNDNINKSMNERVIDLALVQVGDILKILPGQTVPVDGIVTYGQSYVNEAIITGEAEPLFKFVGEYVIGGTMNGHGLLYICASRIGSETALSQIINLIEVAQTSKTPIQEYSDRVSQYFVPAVIIFALFTWLFWFMMAFGTRIVPSYLSNMNERERAVFSFKFGIAVLVVSCPCALGLAAPTAVMVSTGVGARYGVLVKGAGAIEASSKVTTVVFDKTGTITKGKPEVTEVLNLSTYTNCEILELVGTAELASEHPVAKAITQYARDFTGVTLGIAPDNFEALPGLGIECYCCTSLGKIRVVVGNKKLMQLHNISIPPLVLDFFEEKEVLGTVVIAAIDDGNDDGWRVIASVAVCDEIDENASSVISLLRMMGIKAFILSGDNITTCNEAARLCGIPLECVFASCLPKQKSNRIAELQATGEVVAMVGDGLNDSPALVLADIGVAIGAGTDIAMKSADAVLVRSDLLDVVILIDLARKTLQRIKLNLFFSFVYNVICMPLAAGLFYPWFYIRLPPVLSGLMMSLSSVTVVVSSLLLQFYRPPRLMDTNFRDKENLRNSKVFASEPDQRSKSPYDMKETDPESDDDLLNETKSRLKFAKLRKNYIANDYELKPFVTNGGDNLES